jgi:polysaccharide biosynthesis/export protein
MKPNKMGVRVKILESSRSRAFSFGLTIVLSSSCVLSGTLWAQNRTAVSRNNPELSRQNMSRVAASATELKAVLLKDAGLLVELKRWVATDATSHGQIVSDADLTDAAIFDRLEADIQFRSVATQLVQRYGHLVPKVNPDSDVGKEHELLIQERAKWIAQSSEQERLAARQAALANSNKVQATSSCDPQSDLDCNIARNSEELQIPGEPYLPQESGPGGAMPSEPGPSGVPKGGEKSLRQVRLTKFQEEYGSTVPQLPLGTSEESTSAFNLLNSKSDADNGIVAESGLQGQNASLLAVSNQESRSSVDPLTAFGVGASSGNALDGNVLELTSLANRDRNSPELLGVPPAFSVTPMQPSNRRLPQRIVLPTPELVRAASPYNDIPSLYDMYIQATPRPMVPKRFGAEVFENGTRYPQLIPMDLPAGPDYVVGPGDGLAINLRGGVTQRLYRVVDREGRVSLPEIGPLLVSGKTLAQVQQYIQEQLRTELRRVSADVSLARLRTVRVYEVGDVAKPGAYDISSLSTPLNALFAAGGATSKGSLRIVKHFRGSQLLEVVDLYDLLLHGVKSDLQRLENGDTVLVPPIGPQVTVGGMVRRPAVYELKDEKDLAKVLELAGGLLPSATLRHVEVQRLVAHDKQTMISLDLPEIDSDLKITKQLEAFEIRDGDRIRVFPIAPYNQDAVYLEGHVIRPGRYSYRANMKITDVVASYKDLLPEPASQYAEIVRLNAPDFHPTVESFDLAEALANPGQAPTLHAMDTVRIFSRFDFENPPAVSVLGDVRRPGTYRTSGQIHLSDAVHLAGGLAPDAKTEDVQIFRYLPDGKSKIFSVSLNLALEGDPTSNIILQPRDRLLIHRSPESIEPPSVYLQGEVGNPGRYPLTGNMTVADLIRVGGGLKPSADTQLADLMQYQWQKGGGLGGQHEAIAISAALSGDPKANLPLSNGDVVTVRQLPGWNDLGASISVKGEVKHPGTYGIRPGERLSSILQRAGGFQPNGYVYGAVLERVQVRDLEMKEQAQMILRVKDLQSNLELLPEGDPKQRQAKQMALQQYQTTLTQLTTNTPVGRVAIRISSDVNRWKNTPADLEVRAGDTLIIPKRPSFVMVSGQVFNPTAVAYRPGKSAAWYLSQSGGPTKVADKKSIFVIRADGSVLGTKESWWAGRSLNSTLQPGDTVVVPEKAIGGGIQWQTVFLAAQVAASITSTIFIALRY